MYIFINSRKLEKDSIARTAVNYLTFFVVFEALIGAVIVVFEWVGLNSSLPRIIAVPIHLVNTFGLLASYVILYKILENKLDSIKNLWDKFVAWLFSWQK
jgi:heme A synthase